MTMDVRHLLTWVAALALVYVLIAYVVLPLVWRRFERRHPLLADIPGITHTGSGIPGDPLNVALIGNEAEVKAAFAAAKWLPADPLSLRADIAIAVDTVRKRSDPEAPVSNLYLWGRKEDLAFEQQMDGNPRERHHVRFWKAEKTADDGRPVWVGSGTFDLRVGFSDRTGQFTHHIARDIDAERDHIFQTLQQAGVLANVETVANFHTVREGRNGGGDPWVTDGALSLGTIRPGA